MTNDHAASVQGTALRIAKLGSDGKPLVGANNCYATTAFTRLSFTPEYSEGDEIEEKAADGSVCVYYEMPSTLKRVVLELAICAPDPEIIEILAGGTILKQTTETMGWQAPAIGSITNPNGISIEVWSRAIVGGKMAATNPYWRWVFPWTQMRMSGERVLENGAMANVFEGWGVGNGPWATGPAKDWTYSSDSAFQYARGTALPTGMPGYVVVA